MNKILIAVAIYDTDENKRTKYTIETYKSLFKTINTKTTEVYFVDNASCKKTKNFLKSIKDNYFHVITNEKNAGTAEAINKVIKLRKKRDNTYIVKMDNDITVEEYGWADKLVTCFERDKKLGILGLKRKDLKDSPTSDEYKTNLRFLPHKLDQTWLPIEESEDILGSCTMYNPLLLDKVGYLYQPAIYGYDDVLMSKRSILSGFYNAFYPSIEINHIDTGGTIFIEWKKEIAGSYMNTVVKIIKEYQSGNRPLYYNPFE